MKSKTHHNLYGFLGLVFVCGMFWFATKNGVSWGNFNWMNGFSSDVHSTLSITREMEEISSKFQCRAEYLTEDRLNTVYRYDAIKPAIEILKSKETLVMLNRYEALRADQDLQAVLERISSEQNILVAGTEFGFEEVFEGLVALESQFKDKATSWAGADGLTQTMPGTEKYLRAKVAKFFGINTENVPINFSPIRKFSYAGGYLYFKEQVQGTEQQENGIARYHMGPGNFVSLRKAFKKDQDLNNHQKFGVNDFASPSFPVMYELSKRCPKGYPNTIAFFNSKKDDTQGYTGKVLARVVLFQLYKKHGKDALVRAFHKQQ